MVDAGDDRKMPLTCAFVTDSTASTGSLKYGWLGAKQRAVTGAQLILMGVRLYNPITGLFTALDPQIGGNANAYTYPSDPINSFDLDGKWGRPKWLTWKNVARVAAVAAFGVCVFASAGACAVAGVAAAAFAARSSARRWGGRRFWGDFAKGSAWALGGAGVGKGIGLMYRHNIRYAKHMRYGRWRRGWSRFRGYGGRAHTRGPGALHYMHQAKAGFVGSVYSYGWYKRRNRRNYGAD